MPLEGEFGVWRTWQDVQPDHDSLTSWSWESAMTGAEKWWISRPMEKTLRIWKKIRNVCSIILIKAAMCFSGTSSRSLSLWETCPFFVGCSKAHWSPISLHIINSTLSSPQESKILSIFNIILILMVTMILATMITIENHDHHHTYHHQHQHHSISQPSSGSKSWGTTRNSCPVPPGTSGDVTWKWATYIGSSKK